MYWLKSKRPCEFYALCYCIQSLYLPDKDATSPRLQLPIKKKSQFRKCHGGVVLYNTERCLSGLTFRGHYIYITRTPLFPATD